MLKALFIDYLMLFLGQLVMWHQKKVIVELMKKKCLPILYYAIEVCPLNKAHINSLDFAVGSCFMYAVI